MKAIKFSDKTWQELMHIKIEKKMRSLDSVIELLLEEYYAKLNPITR